MDTILSKIKSDCINLWDKYHPSTTKLKHPEGSLWVHKFLQITRKYTYFLYHLKSLKEFEKQKSTERGNTAAAPIMLGGGHSWNHTQSTIQADKLFREHLSNLCKDKKLIYHGIFVFWKRWNTAKTKDRSVKTGEALRPALREAFLQLREIHEIVPHVTWMICLGNLADSLRVEDLPCSEDWAESARIWYSKASSIIPTCGQLYYRTAQLLPPREHLARWNYLVKSQCTIQPYRNYNPPQIHVPILDSDISEYQLEKAFLEVHESLFNSMDHHLLSRQKMVFFSRQKIFLDLLDRYKSTTETFGYYIAISNVSAILGYGSTRNSLMKIINQATGRSDQSVENISSTSSIDSAESLSNSTLRMFWKNSPSNDRILSFVHVVLVFIHYISHFPEAMDLLQRNFPWQDLDGLLKTSLDSALTEGDEIHWDEEQREPLPEDFAMQGLLWTEKFYPRNWLIRVTYRGQEHRNPASMKARRQARIIWLSRQLGKTTPALQIYSCGYPHCKQKFSRSIDARNHERADH
ncbi:hypothetical protein ACMFMG_002681 [Clarireedia jacksonii]